MLRLAQDALRAARTDGRVRWAVGHRETCMAAVFDAGVVFLKEQSFQRG